jgi:hypothetical protein
MQFQHPQIREPLQPLTPVARKPGSSPWIVIAVLFGIVVTVGAGIFGAILKKPRSTVLHLGESDVGKLAELASVQAQLMQLDACELSYNTRDRHGKRSFDSEHVHVRSCSGGSDGDTILIQVKPARSGFTMSRGSAAAPFEIWVEKDDIPFAELKAMLEEFAPTIAAAYSTELAANRALHARVERETQRAQAAEAARKAGARETYPTK